MVAHAHLHEVRWLAPQPMWGQSPDAANGVDNELLLLRGKGHVAAFLFGGAAEDAGAAFLARTLTPAH